MNNNLSSADELKTIRKIMEESTRFLTLSGLSGIFAGFFALAGAIVAWYLIPGQGNIPFHRSSGGVWGTEISSPGWLLIIDAITVLILSIGFSLWFSARKARAEGKSLWTPVSKRLLINMMIPLVTGGLFIIILIIQNHSRLIIPGLLIFYGLALVNAGKFTYSEIFYLGLLEIFTGLVGAFFPDYGIIFWIVGFGLLHIIYGSFMYRKYEV
jgi:hypothetical protein